MDCYTIRKIPKYPTRHHYQVLLLEKGNWKFIKEFKTYKGAKRFLDNRDLNNVSQCETKGV